MTNEGVKTYSHTTAGPLPKPVAATSRLEIPATLILDFKQHLPQHQNAAQQARVVDAPATIISISPEAFKAANGPVSHFNKDDTSSRFDDSLSMSRTETPPSQELVQGKDGSMRVVITFYDPSGNAIMTIPPKDSFSDAITALVSHQDYGTANHLNEVA